MYVHSIFHPFSPETEPSYPVSVFMAYPYAIILSNFFIGNRIYARRFATQKSCLAIFQTQTAFRIFRIFMYFILGNQKRGKVKIISLVRPLLCLKMTPRQPLQKISAKCPAWHKWNEKIYGIQRITYIFFIVNKKTKLYRKFFHEKY